MFQQHNKSLIILNVTVTTMLIIFQLKAKKNKCLFWQNIYQTETENTDMDTV